MNDDEKTFFDTPFDHQEGMPPYNEAWAERRRVNEKLQQLALHLITKEASVEELRELDSKLEQGLQVLDKNHELLGRQEWVATEADHGSYGIISREITPLSGNSNVLAPPMHVWFDREKGKAYADVTLNWLYEGPPKCAHGGMVAALFDEFLGCAQVLSGEAGATGSLTLHYHRPTPLNTELHFEGRIESLKGRKLIMVGELYANDKLCVTAEGLFITIKEGVMFLADRAKGR